MKNLESVTKLYDDGKYKYIGFMLLTDPDTIKEELEIGTQLLFFKDIESDELHFILNTKILGSTPDQPYGVFQLLVGSFTHNFDIEKVEDNDRIVFNIYDKDLEEAKALKEKEEAEQNSTEK